MTLAMKLAQGLLPPHQRHPLPPRRVMMRALGNSGRWPYLDLNEPQRRALSLAAHYGYGTAVGGMFGMIAPRRLPDAVSAGIGYGLLVWAASYLGLLPALDLHRPATRESPARNAMMIAAHVVWGATVGIFACAFRRTGR